MVRLRNAVMAVALGTGVMGCAFSNFNIARISIWHCDECDDFPMPAYGPGFSMMPGTYTGTAPRDSVEPNRPSAAAPGPGSSPPPQQQPVPTTPPATPTLPLPPSAAPGQGADARQPGSPIADPASAIASHGPSDLPALPAETQSDLPVSVASP
jgi:hypothetical protein